MADPYEELLKKAYANITEIGDNSERFHIPDAKVYLEGKTTVIENFTDIASYIRREPDQLMKALVGELGTAGKIEGTRAVFNGKFDETMITSAIKKYVEDYVICSECGRPDTRLVKDGRVLLLRCDACGGHRPVRKRRARTEEATNQLEEGSEMDVTIGSISRRGDGVVKIGKYIMYVSKAKPGQTVKVRITRVSGSIVFTERV
ncbi:translation initiation factor IF-2 subunit beta [Methanofollis aquaemaris]|uniref:Translation initiation factor 2 subunit beta n=1 Tax=Methanofollis aquaemaris TaxID=126734 RepID=A0A8A3S8F9_9EURY|nr:translation initiation factor IF-2 subunit beta [Methanofollis aquaemaris]QSZ68405.1 translation initiation factor IF-2 subunit beta [Methanofollis aquaemaris]